MITESMNEHNSGFWRALGLNDYQYNDYSEILIQAAHLPGLCVQLRSVFDGVPSFLSARHFRIIYIRLQRKVDVFEKKMNGGKENGTM